jgi:hypothetical protein
VDEEKEGQGTSVLGTVTDAAKTSMDAVIEGVSSAATSIAFADLLKKHHQPVGFMAALEESLGGHWKAIA